jgi:hypothetical protein
MAGPLHPDRPLPIRIGRFAAAIRIANDQPPRRPPRNLIRIGNRTRKRSCQQNCGSENTSVHRKAISSFGAGLRSRDYIDTLSRRAPPACRRREQAKLRPFGRVAVWLTSSEKTGGRGRTRTYEGVSQRIYSPPPLPLGTLSRTIGGHLMSRRPARARYMLAADFEVNRKRGELPSPGLRDRTRHARTFPARETARATKAFWPPHRRFAPRAGRATTSRRRCRHSVRLAHGDSGARQSSTAYPQSPGD